MKRINKSIYAALSVVGILFAGCQADDAPSRGDGKVVITATVSSDLSMGRASYDETSLAENCLIWISGNKGLVRKYEGLGNVPSDGIWLASGHYLAEAWTGDSVAASFDARYYTGAVPFDITAGATSQVKLTCRIANTVVAVNYSEDIDKMLSEYTMTVGHSGQDLVFEGREDTRRGYYMMSSRSKDLTWTLTGKLPNGDTYTRTGMIADAKRSTLYTLNVSYNATDTEVGGGYFSVEVDETAIEVNDEVVIKVAPDIRGVDFDLADGLRAKPGQLGDVSLYISAATALNNVTLESEDLITVAGLSGADVNLLSISEAYRETLREKGIEVTYHHDAEADVSAMRIDLKSVFTAALSLGQHTFKITAVDADGRSNYETLTIVIDEADESPVVIQPVPTADVWATSASVRATVKDNVATDLSFGFKYRKAGDQQWSEVVSAMLQGNTFSAELTGLESATEYEVVAVAGDVLSGNIERFTTETAAQLPNASFEDTYTSGSTIFFADKAENLFWDTGNTGSSTLRKNVTEPDVSISHSGNQSVRLSSQFVGISIAGKFAAGNLFIGKYLKTVGMDGVLGWGRPFASRPKALRGWVKYRPAAVDHVKSDYPEVSEGDLDKGIIYIALLTDHTEEFEGVSYPVIVKTKASERQLFDKNASNVIAYGEKVWDAATDGEELIEFTIDLTYYRGDIKPDNIMLVAAASKGGDYFVGGASTMWLDDLELVY